MIAKPNSETREAIVGDDLADLRVPDGLLSTDLPTAPRPRSRAFPTRPLLLGAGAAVVLAGAVTTGWVFWPAGPSRTNVAAIPIGPFPEMPEIKDGVPALAMPKPRVIGMTSPANSPTPAPVPAPTAGVKAADGQDKSPTIEALLDPPKPTPSKPVAPARTAPAGSSGPLTTASLPSPSVGAEPARRSAAPAPTPVAKTEVPPARPSASPTAAVSPPVAATPVPPRAPERAAAVSPKKTEKVAAEKPEKSEPRPAKPAVARSAEAAPTSQSSGKTAKADEDVEILGLPIPFGRQIRQAARNVADAVTGGE